MTAAPTARLRRVLLALGLLTALLLPALPAAPALAAPATAGTLDAAGTLDTVGTFDAADTAAPAEQVRVLVELATTDDPAGIAELVLATLAGTDHTVLAHPRHLPVLALELPVETAETLATHPEVVRVVEDEPLSPLLAASVPAIGAELLWDDGITGGGRAVAVLDTGVDRTHPFLSGRVVAEACFSQPSDTLGTSLCPNGTATQVGRGAATPCTLPGCEHGTHVAGIVAGARGVGPGGGVAPGADILAVQVFHRTAQGELQTTGADLLRALDWVAGLRATHRVAAVNLSLGGERHVRACPRDPLEAVAARLLDLGVVTVAASGNDGWADAVSRPACAPSILAVGAVDTFGIVADYSNAHPTLLDLLAPGSRITSSVPGGGYARLTGTSMATPHVAGAVALLRQREPNAAAGDLVTLLRRTGVPVTDTRVAGWPSFPRIDLGAFASSAPLVVDGQCTRAPFLDVGPSHAFCPQIAIGAASGMLQGWPDGTFRPNRDVTRQAAVAFLYQLAGSPPVAVTQVFTDVGPTHPFAAPTAWAVATGITEGFPDGTFRPSEPVTRRAAAAFLARSVDAEVAGFATLAASRFTDVTRTTPFAAEIGWLVDREVTTGWPNATFRPGNVVTRQALAAWLVRLSEAAEPPTA